MIVESSQRDIDVTTIYGMKMHRKNLIAHDVKGILNLVDIENKWQKDIDDFEDVDGRVRPKEHEEMKKKKVKMKKKTRRIAEFKVWSKRKKKKTWDLGDWEQG